MAWTTPPTFTVNEVLTSGAMNGITGDLAYLYGDTTWSPPTMLNSWTNVSNAGYRRVGNLVLVRGEIQGGADHTVAFALAAGYRPPYTSVFSAVNSTSTTPAQVVIATGGNVTVQNLTGTPDVYLDGIFFSLI